ncbi:outer membrane beta-barrel protein [Persicobacter sp. CCB-QB2]|uniref:outer membrane beta-barrel protein n=1 Tax=Persicobacter sp. CCB-QB2 TaxID=1561025 RepID=UPI0006A94C83|nr:outer membrane beta-barrel protein [Persicobacter sp. CCB-QB2]
MRFYKYFLLSCFIFCLGELKAQQFIGVRAAGAVSSVGYTNNVETNQTLFTTFIPAYSGGVFYRLYTSPNAGLQIGLDYSKKGFAERVPESRKIGDNPQTESIAADYTYLEVPLMSSFYVFKGSTKVVINLGPYFAYQLSNVQKVIDVETGNIKSEEQIEYDDFRDNRFDLGIRAEIGMLQSFGQSSVELTGIFSVGLKNIINPDYPGAPYGTLNIFAGLQMAYLFQFDLFKERFPFVDRRKKMK